MNKRLDPDMRKQQIIEAAAAVFARKGFYQASMDDIVQESGLSKGGLYWHFKSKDDIVTAVLDQFFSAEMDEINEILMAPLSVSEKLRQLVTQMMADTVEELNAYLNIWLEFYAVAAREGSFRDRMLVYMQQFIELFALLIQQGMDNEEFRPINARETAITLTAQFEGLILLWAIDPETMNLLQLAETAVDIFLEGVRKHT
ncbi:MAG: TetR/AcrR family transcriptional regulator [Chloroflexota bacterium]|nr:TetR/AcrR family transcriptional regulator [Anaerolineales bacterium]MCA9976720.1 TetR/AcrR family transcriptional regulator [Anaerolineales bacterium]MCB8967492.1 TetR/AcrR family transcriptional regulator [Ardenticatenaceae bacterium]